MEKTRNHFDPPELAGAIVVLATAAKAVLNVGGAVVFGFAVANAVKRGWLKL